MTDNDKRIYRVTVSMSTAVYAKDKYEAMAMVADTFPDDIQFGEPGNILPFEYEGMTTQIITDEDIGRG